VGEVRGRCGGWGGREVWVWELGGVGKGVSVGRKEKGEKRRKTTDGREGYEVLTGGKGEGDRKRKVARREGRSGGRRGGREGVQERSGY